MIFHDFTIYWNLEFLRHLAEGIHEYSHLIKTTSQESSFIKSYIWPTYHPDSFGIIRNHSSFDQIVIFVGIYRTKFELQVLSFF